MCKPCSFDLIWKYELIFYFHVLGADMSCFQGLFFCPEAASLLLHNFCIYHISPPGHEVCKSIDLNVFFTAFRSEYYYLHGFSSGNSTRVLAVGSCCNLFWWSCPFCWRLGRSNSWGPQLLWVTRIYLYCLELFLLLQHNQYLSRSNVFAIFTNGMKYFPPRLGAVMCMGVTAGAYILTLFAVGPRLTLKEKKQRKNCAIVLCSFNMKSTFILICSSLVCFYRWNIGSVLLV